MATAPSLYRKLAYNQLTDFDYVSQVIDVPMTQVGRKDLPAEVQFQTATMLVEGPAGAMEVLVDAPAGALQGYRRGDTPSAAAGRQRDAQDSASAGACPATRADMVVTHAAMYLTTNLKRGTDDDRSPGPPGPYHRSRTRVNPLLHRGAGHADGIFHRRHATGRAQGFQVRPPEDQPAHQRAGVRAKAHTPVPGALDLCFIPTVPLDTAIARLEAAEVPIVEGPVLRTGATAKIRSVYIRDPDLNLIGISELA